MSSLVNTIRNTSSSLGEPLHPIVQMVLSTVDSKDKTKKDITNRLRLFSSEDYLLSIPPEHLQEFTYLSRRTGQDKATFVFIDPSYGGLEKYILFACRNGQTFLFRWGYPGQGLEQVDWREMYIETYIPTVSHAGMRITMECAVQGSYWGYLNEPVTYKGKISTVVRKIAEEMEVPSTKIFVEETVDDANENKEWALGNLTRIDFINQKLLKYAKSKTNPSDKYEFSLDAQNNFWFCTPSWAAATRFAGAVSAGAIVVPMYSASPSIGIAQGVKSVFDVGAKQYRKFNVLYGTPTGVLSFAPRFEGKALAPLVRGIIGCTYDPRSKVFIQRSINKDTIGFVDKSIDSQTQSKMRTNAPPFTNSTDSVEQRKRSNAVVHHPTQLVALGGRCAGKTTQPYNEPEAALCTMENAYETMYKMLSGGELELLGLPEHADFDSHEVYCDINVVLPSSVESLSMPGMLVENGQYLHWSSGRYEITEVTHHISSMYLITVELRRPTQREGASEAKSTSSERIPQAEEVAVK